MHDLLIIYYHFRRERNPKRRARLHTPRTVARNIPQDTYTVKYIIATLPSTEDIAVDTYPVGIMKDLS